MLKVALGTWKAYNEGELADWIDIDDFKDKDDLIDYLKKKYKEQDPEPMVQDADHLTDFIGENPDLNDLFVINDLLNEYEGQEGAIEDAIEIAGVEDAEDKMGDLIGDRKEAADLLYDIACENVQAIGNDKLEQYFQMLVDRIDFDDDVDVAEANGEITSGSNGFYFWN